MSSIRSQQEHLDPSVATPSTLHFQYTSLLSYCYQTSSVLLFKGVNKGVASLSHKCQPPLLSARQHQSYSACLEVRREYYQNCSVLGCVTQCSQSAAHSYEQFLQVQLIGFVTLGPLHFA